MNVRGNNIHCSNECMETELQGCYILHVCAKELLTESERAISATVPQCTDSDKKDGIKITGEKTALVRLRRLLGPGDPGFAIVTPDDRKAG
jgi:hypothetical protein